MARTRMLKPEFFTDHELWQAEQSSGLPLGKVYQGLWCHADREGRFKWEVHRLKLGILPFDVGDFGAILDALAAAGFVEKYEVGGKWYGLIPNFKDHQHFHKSEARSALPAPPSLPVGPPLSTGALPVGSRESPPVTDTDTDTEVSPRGGWPVEAHGIWTAAIGELPIGRLGKALKPLVDRYGWDEPRAPPRAAVRVALACYVRDAPWQQRDGTIADLATPAAKNLAFVAPKYFVQQYVFWSDRARAA